MKLDPKTVKILKNFADINPSIQFRQGNVLSTISPAKTIMARAKVADTFERNFAIYDLSKLLSVLSMFQEPEIELQDDQLIVSKDKNKIKYTYTDPSLIVIPPEKEVKLPSEDIQFALTAEMFQAVNKAMSILALPEMVVAGSGGKLFLRASDSKNPTGDSFEIEVGETDKEFELIFKSENLKIIQGNYNVSVSSKGFALFVGEDVEYFIAVEATSKYN